MAKKFDPLEYNYELVSENNSVFHFQKVLKKEKLSITDVIEISFWSTLGIWIIYVESLNLNQFLPSHCKVEYSMKIPLFIGQIKGDFDYQLLTKRICMDAETLIQIG